MKKQFMAATAVIALSVPAAVQAQSQTATASSRGGIEEIIVTAEKRAANVQDVPVAITVLNGDALEKIGGSNFTDIAKMAPSMTFQDGGNPAVSSISLRGVGTFAYGIGVESSVLVVVDDIALAQQSQALTDLVDIERIEVLRGPQSTLFGKSASAGVISVTTKQPSDRFTARAEVKVTDDDEQRYALSLSGPITNTLAFRVSGTVSRYDGNVRNLYTGKMINGKKSDSVFAKLRWEPSDSFDATLFGHYNKTRTECCGAPLRSLSPSARLLFIPSFTPAVFAPGVVPGKANTKLVSDMVATPTGKDRGVALKMNWGIGEHTLTSITSLNRYSFRDYGEIDNSAVDVLGYLTGGRMHGGVSQHGVYGTHSFSQELRLTSPDKPFKYVLGAYYADNDLTREFERGPVVSVGNFSATSESKSYALFGQADWRFAEKVGLVAGARINRENIAYTFTNNVYGQNFHGSNGDTAFTGKLGLQYMPSKDVMLFATYARGYKGQTYDLTTSFNAAIAALQPVKAEHADSYEVGMKGTFLDRRLMFNVTAFTTDYRNFQAQSLEPTVGGALRLDNVGSLRTRGVEVEWMARPVQNFTLSGGLAYIDAKIKKYPNAQCYAGQTVAQGCVSGRQDLAGAYLSNAPKWKANIVADYTVELPSLPFDANISMAYSWQSKVQYQLSQDPTTIQKAFGITDLNIGIKERESGRYSVTLFARNVFNKHYASGLFNYVQLFGAESVTQFLPRDFSRYVGVSVAVSY